MKFDGQVKPGADGPIRPYDTYLTVPTEKAHPGIAVSQPDRLERAVADQGQMLSSSMNSPSPEDLFWHTATVRMFVVNLQKCRFIKHDIQMCMDENAVHSYIYMYRDEKCGQNTCPH